MCVSLTLVPMGTLYLRVPRAYAHSVPAGTPCLRAFRAFGHCVPEGTCAYGHSVSTDTRQQTYAALTPVSANTILTYSCARLKLLPVQIYTLRATLVPATLGWESGKELVRRGMVTLHGLHYVSAQRPRVILLEQVAAMLDRNHRQVWQFLLKILRLLEYEVSL